MPFGSVAFSRTTANGYSWNDVSLQPGVFVFALDHLSLGLSARYDYRGNASFPNPYGGYGFIHTSTTQIGIEPMLGAALNLSDSFSFFPQAGVDIFHDSTSIPFSQGQTSAELETFVPALFSPFPHFFIGLGPYFEWTFRGLSSGTKEYGLQSQIGGWF